MNEPYRTILIIFIACGFDAAAFLAGYAWSARRSGLRLGRLGRARTPAPRPRTGLGGLGEALKAIDDGVSQISWPFDDQEAQLELSREWQRRVQEAQEERRRFEAAWYAAERMAADLKDAL